MKSRGSGTETCGHYRGSYVYGRDIIITLISARKQRYDTTDQFRTVMLGEMSSGEQHRE